jgi:histidinol phosphatase-like enzyme
VINVRKMGGYILSYDEFVFINGVKEAFKIFSSCFDRIFIITNQQGIGKGLMKEEDFLLLSNKMIDEIKQEGGRVDKIYFLFCTQRRKKQDEKARK